MTRTTTLEAAGCPAQLRAICCDALGFVKVVESRCENGAENGPLDVVAKWGQPGDGVSAMSYSNSSNRLAVARKSGAIEVLDSKDGNICSQLSSLRLDDSGKENGALCGLHLFREDNKYGQAVLSCDKNGHAALQAIGDEDASSSRWDVCKSGDVLSMTVHNSEKIASFGGDRVELSLWDLETNSKVWEAKKPRPDSIGLISFPYVTASTFLLEDDHRKLVIGTGDYQVRLYDIHAQKRPVVAVTYEESPIKAVAEDPDGFTVYVGNSTGSMASFDMRTGKLLAGFKGKLAGSVRSIARHPTLGLIASCGLDRFLRVHDVRNRQLLGKVFLKQPLVGVDFADLITASKAEEMILTESKEIPQGKRKKIEGERDQRMDNGDEDGDGEDNRPRKSKKPKKHKQPKRKQAEEDEDLPDEAEDDEALKPKKKKLKEPKKLKRKQNAGEQQEEDAATIAKEKKKKKKKIQASESESSMPKQRDDETSTIKKMKKKRTREEQ